MDINNFVKFLEDRKKSILAEADKLIREDRKDESAFYKAKANIYDVFSAILSFAKSACGEDKEKFVKIFLEKTEQIPANWKKSLELARTHGDEGKALIEEFKLSAVDDIVEEFKKQFGGN